MNGPTTFVACLTAPGSSALATIGIDGPRAWEIVQPYYQPQGQRRPEFGRESEHWLGRLTTDGVGDQIVLTLSGTSSTTHVELHCHGGPTILRWLLDRFVKQGAMEISWPQWLLFTAPNRLQGAIQCTLTQAPTLRTAAILLEQANGALEKPLHAILSLCGKENKSPALAEVIQLLDSFFAWSDFGVHLTQPWRVVIAGLPNVGKSSLINALLGYQRSITAELPGTTRDVLTARTTFDGWPVELIDTAGLRDASDALEAQGVAKATSTLREAELVLWVVDLTAPLAPPGELERQRLLVVGNKADLSKEVPSWVECSLSALTGTGLPEMMNRIVATLIPKVPPPGTALPVTQEIVNTIKQARDAASCGQTIRLRQLLEYWLLPAVGDEKA